MSFDVSDFDEVWHLSGELRDRDYKVGELQDEIDSLNNRLSAAEEELKCAKVEAP